VNVTQLKLRSEKFDDEDDDDDDDDNNNNNNNNNVEFTGCGRKDEVPCSDNKNRFTKVHNS